MVSAVMRTCGLALLASCISIVSGDLTRLLTRRQFSAGAFNFSQAALPLLLKSTHLQHPPSLIFTGATASVKANAMMSSFATGKWALRALAQSLAKEFGPKGVHVGHAIIDGVIDIPRTKGWNVSDAPDSKISAEAVSNSFLNSNACCKTLHILLPFSLRTQHGHDIKL